MSEMKQAFERHPKLAAWIEKLASRKIEGFSWASWCAFLGEINKALDSEAAWNRRAEPVGTGGVGEWVMVPREDLEALTPECCLGCYPICKQGSPNDKPMNELCCRVRALLAARPAGEVERVKRDIAREVRDAMRWVGVNAARVDAVQMAIRERDATDAIARAILGVTND